MNTGNYTAVELWCNWIKCVSCTVVPFSHAFKRRSCCQIKRHMCVNFNILREIVDTVQLNPLEYCCRIMLAKHTAENMAVSQ